MGKKVKLSLSLTCSPSVCDWSSIVWSLVDIFFNDKSTILFRTRQKLSVNTGFFLRYPFNILG